MSECPCFYFESSEEDPESCTCGHAMDEHDEDLDCKAEYVEPDGGVVIHTCMICLTNSNDHPTECYQDECGEGFSHWPPLCCPGCPCGSFEEAHGQDVPFDDRL